MAFIVRPIDLAIFGTLGLLWIGGALFIVVLYRWIRRFEREQDPDGSQLLRETPKVATPPEPEANRALSHVAAAREALVQV